MPFLSLLPLFCYFLTGLLLRRGGVLGRDHPAVLLQLVFFVTLPALALVAVADATLTRDSVLLPLVGFGVNGACLAIAMLAARVLALPSSAAAGLAITAGISNMVFTFPFIVAALGRDALAEAVLYDLGNAVFVATVVNGLAVRRNDDTTGPALAPLYRLLRTPLFIALAAAVVASTAGVTLPASVRAIAGPLGAMTVPLTTIALGAAFRPASLAGSRTWLAVGIRMVGGLATGVAVIALLGIEGRTALVVTASAAAPIGFTAVSLAAVARLDAEQAGAAVSLSIVIGMFTTSMLLWAGRTLVMT